jgi:pimeloyl-ACP methyl ester carboxylesterase
MTMRSINPSMRLLLLVLLSLGVFNAHAQEVAGDWVGQLDGGFKVRIHIDSANSKYTGYLTNPSGNRTDLDEVIFDGSHLRFAVTKLDLSYDANWDVQQRAWVGKLNFQQGYSLTLKRASAAELAPAVHKRPQEETIAAGPLPYKQQDAVWENAAAHNRLAGTLTTPQGAGPFPAVVLVSGTGHNTRDEDVWGHKVFAVIADALSRRGIAALRYDKRGVGGSTGDFDTATTEDFASDAEAAATWLRKQPGIDAKRVGILGHSEGGIIAPMVADTDKSTAFVVLIAGPALRGDALFILQSAMTAKVYGVPDDYISRRKIFDRKLYDAIIAAPSADSAHASAEAIVAEAVKEKIVDQNESENLAHDATTAWFRSFISYDPAPTLGRLNVPVLALYGSLDVQVPAKEDALLAIDALKNNPDATVVTLPGKNHLMQTAKTGGPNEYNDIEETMSPSALSLIADWITEHSRQK